VLFIHETISAVDSCRTSFLFEEAPLDIEDDGSECGDYSSEDDEGDGDEPHNEVNIDEEVEKRGKKKLPGDDTGWFHLQFRTLFTLVQNFKQLYFGWN
jgi:hypothetical protein